MLLAALYIWQGRSYWDYPDGVYALTARAVVHGRALYSDVVAAQPPLLFYAGAVPLALADSLTALRVAMAAVDLALGATVLAAVWRLTGRRGPAVASGLLALVTPWALHEHALLMPETFGAPLLMGAVLLASRRGWTPAVGGALGALAAAFKIAFFAPALLIALASTHVRRSLGGLALAAIALAAVFLAAFGGDGVRDVVRAQAQTGLHSLHYTAGLWAQAGWNLLPLIVPAALAWPLRARSRDPALARALVGALAGSVVLLATLLKQGSYLNVLVVIEPPLLALAATGLTWGIEDLRANGMPGAGRPLAGPGARRPRLLGLALVALALGMAEVGSLLLAPGNPRVFARPLAASAPGWVAGPKAVARELSAARACPPARAYSGAPYVAFLARRRMPGGQPDQFLLAHARLESHARARAGRDVPRCP